MIERTRQPGQGARRGCRGASMIEFVVVMGLLFFLLFGIMEFGFMLSTQLTVQSAAHQGARAAALGKNVNTAVTNGMTGLAGAKVTRTSYNDGSWHEVSPLPSSLNSNNQVRVTVEYTYQTLTFVGAALPGTTAGKRTLAGQAVMRYGG